MVLSAAMRSLEHQAWVEQQLIRIEKAIEQALPQGELTATRLFEALAYASLGGGKRIRALLCLASGESLGANPEVNAEIHSWGGVILHDVINDKFARKAVEKGADGLIPVAAGAGGHAGGLSPFALIQELRQWFDGPIALSGAIACGRSILAAQAMGADLAYMGSAFIATKEANAVQGYKDMIVESSGEDIVYSNLFTGVHGNYLRPSIERAGLDPDNLPEADPSKMNFGSGGNTEAKAWKDIWGCGQGIGVLNDIPTAGEYIDRLAAEYEAAKAELAAKTALTSGRHLAAV